MSSARRAALALAVVAALPATTAGTAAADLAGANDAVASSVVIQTGTSSGSGAIIGEGQVLTAAHVLSSSDSVRIRTESGSVQATVEARDDERDLALLSAPGLDGSALTLSSNPPQLGQSTYAIGAPSGDYVQVSRGIVSAVVEQAGVQRIQTDASVNPGNSGGPLVDEGGDILGVVVTKSRDEEGIAFATSADEVREFLADEPVQNPGEQPAIQGTADPAQAPDESSNGSLALVLMAVLASLGLLAAVLQRRRRGRTRNPMATLDLTHEDLSASKETTSKKEEEQWTI